MYNLDFIFKVKGFMFIFFELWKYYYNYKLGLICFIWVIMKIVVSVLVKIFVYDVILIKLRR